MADKSPLDKIKIELQEGMGLEKCRKCGCMKQGLENPCSTPPSV